MLTHTDPAAWPSLTHAVRRESVLPFTLGGGSNVLAADAGYPGPVIRMATRGITARTLPGDRVEVTVQAGEPLAALVARGKSPDPSLPRNPSLLARPVSVAR